jgi:hypothetical protein
MSESAVHIHAPLPSIRKCDRRECPVCHKRSVILSWFTDWYGWDSTCLRCGDEWADGQLKERPFMPKWRQKNIEAARVRWRRNRMTAPEVTPEGER